MREEDEIRAAVIALAEAQAAGEDIADALPHGEALAAAGAAADGEAVDDALDPEQAREEAIAAVLKYTQYAVKGCPAAREKLHNAAALAGASYGSIVDEVTPRLPYFPTEKEVSINDNDMRCAELAERLGFDSCRALFAACQAL